MEPNIEHCRKIRRERNKDIVLNCGLSDRHSTMKYYMFSAHTLNTFSKEVAENCSKLGYPIIGEREVEVLSINEVLEKYGIFDFVSIDVEGLDFCILQAIDYDKYAPSVICLETQEFCGDKREDFATINEFMNSKGYMIYADTMLNTIYVKIDEYKLLIS